MFKKAVCTLMAVCVLAVCLTCVAVAESDWTAKFKAEQVGEESADGIVNVRVSVSDITSETGIICAIYNLLYDNDCLELISWKNHTPSSWDFSEGSSLAAEDWSAIIEENGEKFFFYTILNVAAENGVKEDDVLYTDLQFKVLDDSATETEIQLTEIAFIDVNDLVNGTGVDLNDTALTLELNTAGTGESSSDVSDETSADTSAEESATASTTSGENTSTVVEDGHVVVDITLCDITDPAGVSSLLFHVKYNGRLLKYISYECIQPENWIDDELYTENMTAAEQTNGDLLFWILNVDPACGVKEDGKLGFRVTFEVSDEIQFDPSLLTIEQVEICNSELQEMSADEYSFSIVQVGGENLGDSSDDGQVVKIVIVIVAIVLVIGGAVLVFLLRKKKVNEKA